MAVAFPKRDPMALKDLVGTPANYYQRRKPTNHPDFANEQLYCMPCGTGDHTS